MMNRSITTNFAISILFAGCLLVAPTSLAAEKKAHVKDFTLKSVADDPIKTFTLSKHRRKHVILHFLLKTTCPICLRLTHEYDTKLAGNDQVVQVFIKPDNIKQIEKWLGKLKDRPTIYHDPDAGLAKKYGVPNGYHFHGQVVHYPAFVLLGPDGKEIFRHVGKRNSDRFHFKQFAEKFPQLVKK